MYLNIKSIIITFFIVAVLQSSCAKVDKDNICPGVECATPKETIRLNIIERSDEVSSSVVGINIIQKHNVRIDLLTIYSNRLKEKVPFHVEFIDKTTSYIVFETAGSDEFEIIMAKSYTDILKVETKYNDDDCCGSLELINATVNNIPVEITNPDNVITIKK